MPTAQLPRPETQPVRLADEPATLDHALLLALERPGFGQLARQVAPVSLDALADAMREQQATGGRLGDLLRRRGLLDREQVNDILRRQAEWVANSFQAEVGGRLPLPVFLSVCMPAYNEAENLPGTLDAALSCLPEFVQEFEIVVVDDGSRDDTAAVVREYARRDPRVRLVSHATNGGYGAAVTSGLRAARGDYVMFCDSDGQFTFLDLPHLLARMGGHDVVVGYRHNRADHWLRKFNAGCWNWLVRLALGVRVRDLDCAFKIFRRDVVEKLGLTSTGAAINAEIMVQVVKGGARVCEVPVCHYPRYAGSPTGAAVKVILRAFRELPRLWRYRFRPTPLLAAPAGSAGVSMLAATVPVMDCPVGEGSGRFAAAIDARHS